MYQTMFFYAVRDYHRGTLPKKLADDAEFMRYVRELADALPIHGEYGILRRKRERLSCASKTLLERP